MTELLESQITHPDAGGPILGGEHECPECGRDDFKSAASLGSHRRTAHGVKGGSAKKIRQPKPPPTPRPPTVREQVLGFYTMLADLADMSLAGGEASELGDAFRQCAPRAAANWAELARRHEWVKTFWTDLSTAGGWPALAFTHIPIMFALRNMVRQVLDARRQAAEAEADREEAFANNGAAA
jgi:hypothetical protein